MADKIDFFWELFEAVSGGTGKGITNALDALAKSDRTKLETYFTQVIDQTSFSTQDYHRLRKFLIDLFATHRSLASQSLASSDPHSLSNSDLDELFRSFGYPHSPQLRGFDENPLEQKIQFFLDLVNLYKVKGTPQSLVDVLQYYGVTEIDIYEFLLKLSSPNNLIFDGKAVAGTTVAPNTLQIPFSNLTTADPHWLYTSQQILQLNNSNKINLPSQTPYLGIQPVVDLDGSEFSIIARYVQDQYNYWDVHGTVPPANAEITEFGEVTSLLELYLSCIYMFNKEFDLGKEQDPCNFLCYDGTNINAVDVTTEFDELSIPPIRRCDLNTITPPLPVISNSNLIPSYSYCAASKLLTYNNDFTRPSTTNFLVDKNSAGYYLNLINPTLKSKLDSVLDPLEVLYSLLKDLSNWVRSNIGFGFVNFGFILFGINEFFKDLKPVIEFFKPYRARLLLLESLQIKNRLFNSIAVNDSFNTDVDVNINDFMTGDSSPCCTPDSTALPICIGEEITKCQRDWVVAPESIVWKGLWKEATEYHVNDVIVSGLLPGDHFICIQEHVSTPSTTKPGHGTDWILVWSLYSEIVCADSTGVNASVHSRDTFDCGSHFDIGAVTDIPQEIKIDVIETRHDHMRCPNDGTGFVVSEITDDRAISPNMTQLEFGVTNQRISFDNGMSNTNYSIAATLSNIDSPASQYNFIITEKGKTYFDIKFSGALDSDKYWLNWSLTDSTNSDIIQLNTGDYEKTITLNQSCIDSTNYTVSVMLRNELDANASVYGWSVINKTTNSFTVHFSGRIDSDNYYIEWFVCEGIQKGNFNVASGVSEVSIPLPTAIDIDYPLLVTLSSNDTDSIYTPVVTSKQPNYFTVKFSGIIDSDNYFVSWSIPSLSEYEWLQYYQSGGFRDFDSDGMFDCTHGFDLVQITVEGSSDGFLLQEDTYHLLQEDESRIII